MQVRITELDSGQIALTSPYNPAMPPKARDLGGRWNASAKAWVFDSRDEQRVRDLAREIYGTDGSPEQDADLVTVRVQLNQHEGPWREGARATFGGHLIAERPDRDANIRLAANVILVAGTLPGRGGSVRYPQLEVGDDVIVEIRDIPRASLSIHAQDTYTIVDETVDTGALRAERTALLARLAEIDATLAAAGHQDADDEEPGTTGGRAVPAADTPAGVITVRIDTAVDGIDGATTAAFADAAGRSPRTIRRWCAAGRIPATRTPRGWIITA